MRAWRKWLKSQRKHDKDSWAADIGVCRGRAAYARRHRGTNAGQGIPDVVPTVSATPFTARSLVGMSQSSRKRRRWEWVQAAGQYDAPGAAKAIGAKLRIGEHLRPCPGCCACWGCEQDPTRINPVSGNTLHWAGPKRKHTFECPMGPPLAGKKSKQIARMLKWQETLPDDCDGSGVLPARRSK